MGDKVSDFLLNNRDLNQVTWEMRIEEGNPKLPTTQDLPDFPYARYADSIGLKGIRVDRPEDVGRAWDEALSADRPVPQKRCCAAAWCTTWSRQPTCKTRAAFV
jgi:thiamine pyrophosphate-dependent acetolactate synthase large subunit-like protein